MLLVHGNHFFRLYQKDQSPDSKVKFRQAGNRCKRVLDDSSISLPVFTSSLKLHNISITPTMVKKIIINLDLSKASGPDCIPVVFLKNCTVAKFEDLKTLRFFGLLFKEAPSWLWPTAHKIFEI